VDLSVWITYLVAAFVLALTPGPGAFTCISSGLNQGFRLGVWTALGLQLANLAVIAIVSLGLGAILLASETLFSAVKWAGVAYLVYLGIATWRAPVRAFESESGAPAQTARVVFIRGFWVNMSNPKAIIFFAAILPQFIDVARPQALQYALIAATTLGVDLIVMTGYVAAAVKVMRAMRNPRTLRAVNRVLGGLFIAAGIALASFRRAATAAA
jgi:homoserine/homoserine lactone efflux protein